MNKENFTDFIRELKEQNEIVEVFQKGFKMGDKVIRFAMVKVESMMNALLDPEVQATLPSKARDGIIDMAECIATCRTERQNRGRLVCCICSILKILR